MLEVFSSSAIALVTICVLVLTYRLYWLVNNKTHELNAHLYSGVSRSIESAFEMAVALYHAKHEVLENETVCQYVSRIASAILLDEGIVIEEWWNTEHQNAVTMFFEESMFGRTEE